MPTYEYRCTKCGHEFEAFQMISEPPVKKCPKCNGKVERLISGGAGLIFKGSGFYITDYKRKNSVPGPEKRSGESSSKDSSSSGSKSASESSASKDKKSSD